MYKEEIDTKKIAKTIDELGDLYKKAKFAHDTTNLKPFHNICKGLMKKLQFINDCYGLPFEDLAKSLTHKNPCVLDSYSTYLVKNNIKNLF